MKLFDEVVEEFVNKILLTSGGRGVEMRVCCFKANPSELNDEKFGRAENWQSAIGGELSTSTMQHFDANHGQIYVIGMQGMR